ncbi:hypothetical protein CMV_021870 [Castanea mollissima]|uniref:Uncharacterized protein n=1 Tax=Castanea mollissima TaxID=60419 RepID=A0A8J4QN89_9ROSI|nr:hypothetical protein CMV_021870 [Castanea mollissima]
MITSKFMLVILHSQSEVIITLDALDYANVHRIDPNHLHISVYAGDFNTLLDYEVTFVLDALDQADIQRIVPNCLHIRQFPAHAPSK